VPVRDIQAVLFDLTGVLTSSPWPALTAAGGGNVELLVGPYHEDTDHPWHRLERGEISIEEWVSDMQVLAESRGATLDLRPLNALLSTLVVHDQVVAHVAALRGEGYRTALVTNNIREGSASWRALFAVDELFEVVVDSSEVGLRKPNPAIFTHTLSLLGDIPPASAVLLDDVETNLVGARQAGLHTILVGDPPDAALAELDVLLGRDGAAPTL
jgi:putative hydrolase of the HAD superfamily